MPLHIWWEGAHQHLGLRQAGLEVVEVEGGVKGEEADLGAAAAGQRVEAVLDRLAHHQQRPRLHRLSRYIYHEEEPRRHRRPHLRSNINRFQESQTPAVWYAARPEFLSLEFRAAAAAPNVLSGAEIVKPLCSSQWGDLWGDALHNSDVSLPVFCHFETSKGD